MRMDVENLVFDFRIKGEDKFVDITTLTQQELMDLHDQYKVYAMYSRRIIEQMNQVME
jgi:hypothetical protein